MDKLLEQVVTDIVIVSVTVFVGCFMIYIMFV